MSPSRSSRQRGSVDNACPCALMALLLGYGVVHMATGGDPGKLPTWAKIALGVGALLVLALGWAASGSGGMASQARPEDPPPSDPPPSDTD